MKYPETIWHADKVSLCEPRDCYHPFYVEGTLYSGDRVEPFFWRVPLHDRSDWERYDFSRAEWTPEARAEYLRLYPERMLCTVPPPDDYRILRHVEIDGRYRLILWHSTRYFGSRAEIGFAFWDGTEEERPPLFIAEDFYPSPTVAIDSDAAILSLLTFLTDRTDIEDGQLTSRQRDWYASSECEELSCNRAYIEEEGDACMDAFILDLPDSPVFTEENDHGL